MNQPIVIRAATLNDRIAAIDVVRSVFIEFGLKFDPEGADADLAGLPDTYTRGGGLFEVVVDGGRVIGTIGLMPMGDGVVELRKMYLLPAARGQGMGHTMLDRAMTWARNAGFERMELDTAGAMVAARHLYEQADFVPLDSGVTQTQCNLRMGREL